MCKERETDGMHEIANAIAPMSAVGGRDAAGCHVESLTEAVMGVTAGLVQIAEAIERLACAAEQYVEADKFK